MRLVVTDNLMSLANGTIVRFVVSRENLTGPLTVVVDDESQQAFVLSSVLLDEDRNLTSGERNLPISDSEEREIQQFGKVDGKIGSFLLENTTRATDRSTSGEDADVIFLSNMTLAWPQLSRNASIRFLRKNESMLPTTVFDRSSNRSLIDALNDTRTATSLDFSQERSMEDGENKANSSGNHTITVSVFKIGNQTLMSKQFGETNQSSPTELLELAENVIHEGNFSSRMNLTEMLGKQMFKPNSSMDESALNSTLLLLLQLLNNGRTNFTGSSGERLAVSSREEKESARETKSQERSSSTEFEERIFSNFSSGKMISNSSEMSTGDLLIDPFLSVSSLRQEALVEMLKLVMKRLEIENVTSSNRTDQLLIDRLLGRRSGVRSSFEENILGVSTGSSEGANLTSSEEKVMSILEENLSFNVSGGIEDAENRTVSSTNETQVSAGNATRLNFTALSSDNETTLGPDVRNDTAVISNATSSSFTRRIDVTHVSIRDFKKLKSSLDAAMFHFVKLAVFKSEMGNSTLDLERDIGFVEQLAGALNGMMKQRRSRLTKETLMKFREMPDLIEFMDAFDFTNTTVLEHVQNVVPTLNMLLDEGTNPNVLATIFNESMKRGIDFDKNIRRKQEKDQATDHGRIAPPILPRPDSDISQNQGENERNITVPLQKSIYHSEYGLMPAQQYNNVKSYILHQNPPKPYPGKYNSDFGYPPQPSSYHPHASGGGSPHNTHHQMHQQGVFTAPQFRLPPPPNHLLPHNLGRTGYISHWRTNPFKRS